MIHSKKMPAASQNTLTAFNPEYWTPTMQETFLKESVALGIANVDLRALLSDGDTVNNPYFSYPRAQTYTKGADIVVKDLSATNEQAVVDTAKVASFYVDDIDKIQNKYSAIKKGAMLAGRVLTNVIDQAVINEYSNAGTTLDDGDIGGTDGNGIVQGVGNISKIFTAAGRVLNNSLRTGGDRFALIGPRILETLQNYIGGRETQFGEKVSANGVVGNRFGFGLKLTNNLPWSATLAMATAPSENDTVTINGVVFRYKATPTAANDVDIGNAATSVANLVAAVNDTGTAGSTYIQLTDEDRFKLEHWGIVATDATTSITFVGFGDIVVAEGLTDGSDVWSAQTQYALMGINQSIDLLAQLSPTVYFRDAQLRIGKYVHPFTLYGTKTFFRNKDGLVAVQFDVSDWV